MLEEQLEACKLMHIVFWRCLQSVIFGCGNKFNDFVDQELLDLIFETLTHTNRFVRETGFYVCGALVTCGAKEGSKHLFICNFFFLVSLVYLKFNTNLVFIDVWEV